MRFSRDGSTPQVGYVPADKQIVVRTQFGMGWVNQGMEEEEEAEMKEIKTVHGWPPAQQEIKE